MVITFKNKRLGKIANDERLCVKVLGKVRSAKFLKRLTDLRIADTLEDVKYLPGHYHELIGERRGQWACDLDQPYRLIFKPLEDPIPVDNHGNFIWIEILGVEILEVLDYH